MKRLTKIILIFILIFAFNVKVLAEGETTGSNTGENGNETASGETGSGSGNESGNETTEGGNSQSDTPTTKKVELTDIKINDKNIVCTEGDAKTTCEDIIKDNTTKKVKVTFKVSDGATTDKKSGFEQEIDEGVTEFKVVVTSNETKRTYEFKITKKSLAVDSTLKSLRINGTEIALKNDENKYKTSVSYSTKKLEVEAVPNSDKAVVVDFKNNKASFDFYDNSKELKIKVQAEDGEITTYIVTVTKRSEADTTLKSLTIKNHKIDFSSEVTDYELKVLKNVSKLDIDAKATDNKANVKITNPALQIGENTIKIEVTNDGDTNTYIIKVTKLDEDDKTLGNLKSLKIENYDLDFSPNKYEYDLNINDENYLSIKAIAKNEDAEVEITGNLDLVDGSIIKIKVSYDEDIYNVYKINIIKDGTVVVKKKVSKKAAALVIVFDVISMIILGIVNIKNKFKNDNNQKEEDNKETKDTVVKRPKKENNLLENLDSNDIDII